MSIVADISFIPRVEQKVNLPVVVTGRAVQHNQKGEIASSPALRRWQARSEHHEAEPDLSRAGTEPRDPLHIAPFPGQSSRLDGRQADLYRIRQEPGLRCDG